MILARKFKGKISICMAIVFALEFLIQSHFSTAPKIFFEKLHWHRASCVRFSTRKVNRNAMNAFFLNSLLEAKHSSKIHSKWKKKCLVSERSEHRLDISGKVAWMLYKTFRTYFASKILNFWYIPEGWFIHLFWWYKTSINRHSRLEAASSRSCSSNSSAWGRRSSSVAALHYGLLSSVVLRLQLMFSKGLLVFGLRSSFAKLHFFNSVLFTCFLTLLYLNFPTLPKFHL